MGVLHLYNVVKSQVPSWTDMETLISMYGESHLFKGKAPTKPKEQLKKYMLVAGVSDSLSRHNHRRLQQTAIVLFFVKQPLLDIMRKRYSVQEGKKESAALLEDMEHLFKSDNDGPRTILKIRALRQWKTQKRLDPVDMLALITEGVQEEEFQLYFDFVSLDRTCIKLLRRLRNSLSKTVAEVHWPNHLLENQYLCGTAWFILERLSHESNLSVRFRDVVEQAFKKVVLREGHIDTEGSRSRCVRR
jgi:hypothetical protein